MIKQNKTKFITLPPRNMGKHKNNNQDNILLDFMRNHQDIAKGFVKGDKVVVEDLWKELSGQLNAAGPPTKDVSNWKKTWIDLKCNIRKKLAHNKIETRTTGGGQFNQYVLARIEEEIAVICGLHKVVDGIKPANNFGAQKLMSGANKENLEINTISQQEIPSEMEEIDEVFEASTPSTSKRRRVVPDINSIVEEENQHLDRIGNVLSELVKLKETVSNDLKKVCETLTSIESIKREELHEMKRHNIQLERSLVTKNEIKIKFLELEKLKLGLGED
ncbi:uncharacterized protein LOC131996765 [Stomoxys calcitrans]|uniref:uncharacterized protein LOC131994967 n=1 Tax=Stomoxys calcitrans TaxID=35570 RepID=UPI0027E3746A|nr:uncharacterized protein LOC131994967 [Stomoxys calcitrans]XP_059222650.1 uncharacterized protein LOC131996765 [Stomoxys calcitrans]